MTVAVIDPNVQTNAAYTQVRDSDFAVDWFSGTGAGGQHRNKKMNSCRVTHVPTGIVETRQGRKRESNLREAKDALIQRLQKARSNAVHSVVSSIRKDQVGSGMRGDKIRTYRFQDDQVHDHNTNKRAMCSKVMKGHFDLLWR